MHRRLAAILAADVVGYSSLMNEDEAATLSALRQLRTELFGPTFAGHQGKLVKSMGDGWLVEFASAVDAVNCAMQLQDRLAGHDRVKLRIGVHVGDVAHEDDDIFGNGVIVAARLEAFAKPGAVAISDTAYFSLDGTLKPSFEDAGEHMLKNIDRAVNVWTRAAPREAVLLETMSVLGIENRAGFPALTIKPVSTSDERPELRELADALTADLGTFLGATRWLMTSTQNDPIDEGYVLQAILRGRLDRVRLEVRLFEPVGRLYWSAKFDGDLTVSFDWQDEVSGEVAGGALAKILDLEKRKLLDKPLNDMTAQECNMRGLMEFEEVSRDSTAESLKYYAAAIDKKPGFAEAYSDAILMLLSAQAMGLTDVARLYMTRFDDWLRAAAPFAAASPMLELAIATVKYVRERDAARLRRAIRDALRQAPFASEVIWICGWGYVWLGEPEEALACFRKGERFFRFNPWAVAMLGGAAVACVQAGDDDEAVAYAHRGLEISTEYGAFYRALAAAYAHMGQHQNAAAALKEALRLVPDDSIASGRSRSGYADTAASRRYFEGLRLAGMPE